MKRLALALTIFAACAWAEEFSGYIADSHCAKDTAKVTKEDHAKCAAACIKKGAKAVLVTEAGKIYQLAEQSKVVPHAGHKVTITGKLEGETIQVESVKM